MSWWENDPIEPAAKSGEWWANDPVDQPSTQSRIDQAFDVQAQNPPTELYGQGGSLARGALQGATLNLADEATGLANASPIPGAQRQGMVNLNPVDMLAGAARIGAEYLAPSIFGKGGQEAYQQGRDAIRLQDKAAQASNPLTYLGGNIAGAIAQAPITPAVSTVRGGAALGAGLGAVGGFGAGEGTQDSLQQAAIGGALGGVVGAGLGKLASRYSQQAPAQQAISEGVQAADQFGIPLTAGQRTGDIALQSLEDAALGGAKGQQAQRVAQEAIDAQRQQILAARDQIAQTAARGEQGLQTASDAGSIISDAAKQAASSARQNFKNLYNQAYKGEGEFNPQALQFIGVRIQHSLASRAEPIIVDDVLTPAASRAVRELDNIQNLKLGVNGQPEAGDQVVGVSLGGVDQARKRLVAFYQAAKSNPSDARAVRGIIDEFDTQIDQAITNGLFSGSEETINSLRQARKAYSDYQKTFRPQGSGDDVGNTLRKIVDRDATPTEVVNYIVGASKAGQKGLSVRLTRRLGEIFGKDSPEWSVIRQAAWQKVAGNTEGIDPKGAQAMSKAVFDFINGDGKFLAQQIFTKEELFQMKQFAVALKQTIPQAGARNFSQSGNRAAAIARQLSGSLGAAFGASQGGTVGATLGYITGQAAEKLTGARNAAQARKLFSGEAPTKLGQSLGSKIGYTSNKLRTLIPQMPQPEVSPLLSGPLRSAAETDQQQNQPMQLRVPPSNR